MHVNPVELLPLAQLRHNLVNPKRPMGARYARGLRTSLNRYGFAGLFVVAANDDGSYEVLDGNTRLDELDTAGVQEVPCVVLNLDHDERRAFVLSHDRHKKPFDEDVVVAQLKELAGRGRDVKMLADLTATENLRQILEESNRAASGAPLPSAQPAKIAQQGSLVLYGAAEDVDAVKQLIKRLRGHTSHAFKVRNLLEQAEQYQDLTDEQFLLCFCSAMARLTPVDA